MKIIRKEERRGGNLLDNGFFLSLLLFILGMIIYISGGSFYLVIKWSILTTVFIGLTLYILHTVRGYIKSLYSTAPVSPVIDVAGHDRRRLDLIAQKQIELTKKSDDHEEKVVKPREEEKLVNAEQEVNKFSEHWKGQGHKLGSFEKDHLEGRSGKEENISASQEAAVRRRLGVSKQLLEKENTEKTQ